MSGGLQDFGPAILSVAGREGDPTQPGQPAAGLPNVRKRVTVLTVPRVGIQWGQRDT